MSHGMSHLHGTSHPPHNGTSHRVWAIPPCMGNPTCSSGMSHTTCRKTMGHPTQSGRSHSNFPALVGHPTIIFVWDVPQHPQCGTSHHFFVFKQWDVLFFSPYGTSHTDLPWDIPHFYFSICGTSHHINHNGMSHSYFHHGKSHFSMGCPTPTNYV